VSLILPPRAASRTRELPDCCRIKFGGARQPVTRRTHSNLAVWISATLNYNMAKLTDEQRRALQLLAREHAGCAEVVLLAEGFSVGQLAELVIDGFAERRPIVTNVGGREKIVVWMQITEAGRAALAD
jgi:hypothetical protein